jgi:methylamine--corrinoid protein Co-methyltransferase
MVPPWRIQEVIERAENGPICLERDFDLKILYSKIQELLDKYDIRFDPENVVPTDDSMADDLWEAGLELYLHTGTLCTDSHRRILFDEGEIKEALCLFPEELIVGAGSERRKFYHRKIEDQRKPFCVFSPSLPFSEELFVPVKMAYAQEPLADGVGAPVLETLRGSRVRSGYPSDVSAAAAHAMMIREAARRVGRPGIYLADVQSALSDTAQIAVSNPEWAVRKTDGRMVGTIAELKIDVGGLNRMVNFHEAGYMIMALFGPMVGGYGGGVEGTALVSVASHLQGLMVNQGHLDTFFPFHIVELCNSTRELLWMISAVYQALARNSPFLSMSNGIGAAGPCTEMVLLEAATHGLVSTVSGAHLWEYFSARNKNKDRTTPIEARMACEVGQAVAKMRLNRENANEFAKTLLERYEDRIKDAPLGKRFQECYDVKRVRPTKEHLEMYEGVKSELGDLGIDFPY